MRNLRTYPLPEDLLLDLEALVGDLATLVPLSILVQMVEHVADLDRVRRKGSLLKAGKGLIQTFVFLGDDEDGTAVPRHALVLDSVQRVGWLVLPATLLWQQRDLLTRVCGRGHGGSRTMVCLIIVLIGLGVIVCAICQELAIS